jgi:superfamily II DNA or RNA helicase
VRIAYGPIWSRVVEATIDEVPLIQQALLTPEGRWMLRPDWCFPTGLAYRLAAFGLPVYGMPAFPNVSDRIQPDMLKGATLRDYQLLAAPIFLRMGRGVAAHATGAGKSILLAAIMSAVGPPSICILETIGAAEQLANKLAAAGVPNVGLVGGGRKKYGDHTCFVIDSARIGLLDRRKKFISRIENAQLLAYDEAHHLGNARTWAQIGLACPAHYRIGLTATPYDDEPSEADMILEGVLGPVFDYIPSKRLRDAGWLSEPYVFLLPVALGDRISAGILDWNRIEKHGIVEHEYRNWLILTVCARLVQWEPDARILIIVRRIKHGQFLVDKLGEVGVKAVFSSGSKQAYFGPHNRKTRRYSEIVKRFEDGEWSVLVGSGQVYDEAQDIPSVTDLVLGAAGKKTRRLLQRLGRGERVAPGKNYVRVWDFYDSQHESLRRQSRRRREVYDMEQIHAVTSPLLIQRILDGLCSPAQVVEAIRGTDHAGDQDHNRGIAQALDPGGL